MFSNLILLYERAEGEGFNAHYVIVTGFDEQFIYVHECGNTYTLPEANKKVARAQFAGALGPDPQYTVWSAVKK